MLKDFILFVYITTLVTRPFFSGHVSAFINKTGNWHVAAPQWKKKEEFYKKYWDVRKIYILHSNQKNNKNVLIS